MPAPTSNSSARSYGGDGSIFTSRELAQLFYGFAGALQSRDPTAVDMFLELVRAYMDLWNVLMDAIAMGHPGPLLAASRALRTVVRLALSLIAFLDLSGSLATEAEYAAVQQLSETVQADSGLLEVLFETITENVDVTGSDHSSDSGDDLTAND